MFYFSSRISKALREKCPNTEFYLLHIFPHLDWIRTDTSYFSVFSPNAGKYGPEKTPSLDTFHAVKVWISVWQKLSRIEIAYFLSSFQWDLKIQILIIQIITCSAAKKYVVVIFSSWFKRIFSHISILISQFTKAALYVFLEKSILKICSKFTGEHK